MTRTDDNKTLSECGIEAGEHVQMSVVAIKGIDITLKTRYGQALQIGDIRDDSTIKIVKEKISEQYGIDINNQIICNGKDKDKDNEVIILDDQQSLKKLPTKILDLIIVENIEIALKEKDKLLNEPYKFIKNAKRGGQELQIQNVWQWPENDGSWHDYDANMQKKLEELDVGSKITFSAGQWTYEVTKTSDDACSYVLYLYNYYDINFGMFC